jgi:SNF2 family DNA or RNA helicase/DNA-binding transcriptional regulator YiaG
MNKTNITVKTRSDGTLVRVLPDGTEQPLNLTAPEKRSASEVEAAALSDEDNPPLSRDDFQRMKAVPRIKTIRTSLGLTQEQFAKRFEIPIGTLRDWEQGRSEPDQPAKAYLNAIARDPHRARERSEGGASVDGPGAEVRDRRDTSVRGVTTGQRRSHAGRELIGVRLLNGEFRFIPSEYLELLPRHERRSEAFAARRTGGPGELVRYLLAEKISGRLTDVYYSMESGKADFFPHQFRPVLKFIESTLGRILVADEVGLGKTISAIYIWKELQARTGARRLLIVCPAVLREKWKAELRSRFAIEARIVDAAHLHEELETVYRDTNHSFALIGGLEGLRSRRRTESSTGSGSRQKLMQWLQDNPSSSDLAPFDLVVVDEAHAARNAKTANHHFVEALRDAAAHLVLLTATPIQTHSENLFNLLRLVDPDRFVTMDTFEQARRANISIIGAVNAILATPPDYTAFRAYLERASSEPLFSGDIVLNDFLQAKGQKWDRANRVRLSRMLESRSLLADVMVRTRKREAFKNRVQRDPWSLEVKLSKEEQQLYNLLSARIRALADRKYIDTPAAFILIGRQRQLASSIPAALKAWKKAAHLQELLWDDLGVDLDASDTGGEVISVEDLLGGYDFEANDTKYSAFSKAISGRLKEKPDEKIVVFAFFRETLSYLRRRLEVDGIKCATIQGSMGTTIIDGEEVDAKTAEINRFASQSGPPVLLSSEVGSEGIDLQFARVVFNYDLPWNPMRVEQRIGRIDRMGQKAERITIGHFAVTGTVDDQILERLYARVNVFKESIGDLDEIFGEKIQEIILEYFRENLTPEEVELRFEQNLLAAETFKLETERLDREAPALAGHAEFILRSIRQSHSSGRFVRPEDLRRYVTDFLHERYRGSSIEYDPDNSEVFRIDLAAAARDALSAFIERERPARHTRLLSNSVPVAFDPNIVVPGKLRLEIIDVTHPLVLWMRSVRLADTNEVVPAVAIEIAPKSPTVQPGLYVFATDLWRIEGVRKQLTLQHVMLSVETGERVNTELTEKMLDEALQIGKQLDLNDLIDVQDILSAALQQAEHLLEEEYLNESGEFEAENLNRVTQAKQLVVARADRKLEQLKAILAQQMNLRDERQRRVIPLTQARIRQTEQDRETQLARIERQGRVDASFRPVIGGLIVVTAK